MSFITGENQETAGTSPLDEISNVKETIEPPVGTSEIKIIDGRSFVFEHNTTRGFTDAKLFCKGKEISECIFIFTSSSKKNEQNHCPSTFLIRF